MWQFLTQMFMMPWSMMSASMEMFNRTMQGMQQGMNQGANTMMSGIGGQTSGSRQGGQSGIGERMMNMAGAGLTGAGQQTTEEERSMRNQSGQDWSSGNQGWSDGGQQQGWDDGGQQQWGGRDQNRSQRDRNLSNDDLKLVRYRILFVKRDYEEAFDEKVELVTSNLTATQFAGLKIAKFLRDLNNIKRPEKWREKNYPPNVTGDTIDNIPAEDEKHLRIYFEVLERFPREEANYERDQVEVLREIRDRIGSSPYRSDEIS